MFLTGHRDVCNYCHRKKTLEFFGHSALCKIQSGENAEPGLRLLKEEYMKGKIIRLDDARYNRLLEIAKLDEPILELVDRLLDIADTAAANRNRVLPNKFRNSSNHAYDPYHHYLVEAEDKYYLQPFKAIDLL
jgi:hypothetical protein